MRRLHVRSRRNSPGRMAAAGSTGLPFQADRRRTGKFRRSSNRTVSVLLEVVPGRETETTSGTPPGRFAERDCLGRETARLVPTVSRIHRPTWRWHFLAHSQPCFFSAGCTTRSCGGSCRENSRNGATSMHIRKAIEADGDAWLRLRQELSRRSLCPRAGPTRSTGDRAART